MARPPMLPTSMRGTGRTRPTSSRTPTPTTTDQEPGGVFHSMIAIDKYLYVVETNRGFVLRVDPRTGT